MQPCTVRMLQGGCWETLRLKLMCRKRAGSEFKWPILGRLYKTANINGNKSLLPQVKVRDTVHHTQCGAHKGGHSVMW